MNNEIKLLENGDFIVLPLPEEKWDNYSGLPSPNAYCEESGDGMGIDIPSNKQGTPGSGEV